MMKRRSHDPFYDRKLQSFPTCKHVWRFWKHFNFTQAVLIIIVIIMIVKVETTWCAQTSKSKDLICWDFLLKTSPKLPFVHFVPWIYYTTFPRLRKLTKFISWRTCWILYRIKRFTSNSSSGTWGSLLNHYKFPKDSLYKFIVLFRGIH